MNKTIDGDILNVATLPHRERPRWFFCYTILIITLGESGHDGLLIV